MMGKPVQEISIPVLIEPDENCYFYQEEEQEGFTSTSKRPKQCTSRLHHSLPPPFVIYGLLSLKKSHPLHYSSGLISDTTLAGTISKTGTISPTACSPTLPLQLPSLTVDKETPASPPRTRKRTFGVISSLPTGRPICPPPFLPRLATGARLVRGAPAPRARC